MLPPVVLQFHDTEEFCAELRTSPPNGGNPPNVRLTKQWTQSSMGFHHVTVLATFLRYEAAPTGVVSILVKLEQYCGEHWAHDESSKALRAAEECMTKVRQVAADTNVDVRPGTYKFPEPQTQNP